MLWPERPLPWFVMAAEPKFDPELQAIVERARVLARERGELRDGPWTGPDEPLPDGVKPVLRDWIDSGGYDRAVAEITADDPDIQTQL